jgi:hypothetical protein
MICALLIFQTPEFHRPLAEITPWLDMQTRDLAEVFADLAAQQHRRFIKTHTPIDGLPWGDDITYLHVTRDPRDVGVSMDNHLLNMNLEQLLSQRAAVAGLDDLAEYFPDGLPERPESPAERFWQWVDDDAPIERSISTLRGTLHHVGVAWEARDRANVINLHFSDLKRDREGQMRMLAEGLAVDVPESRWPELIDCAGFEYMRDHADRIAPNSTQELWQVTADFFRSGANGQWRDILDAESQARYEKRVGDLATPDVAAWAHRA